MVNHQGKHLAVKQNCLKDYGVQSGPENAGLPRRHNVTHYTLATADASAPDDVGLIDGVFGAVAHKARPDVFMALRLSSVWELVYHPVCPDRVTLSSFSRIVGVDGFLGEHIQAGGVDHALGERIVQVGFIHDRPAGSVDQDGGVFHHAESRGIEHAPGLVVQRQCGWRNNRLPEAPFPSSPFPLRQP